MSLPISLLMVAGEARFYAVYNRIIKKIPWYVRGRRRAQLLARCNLIASRKAAHHMTIIDMPFRNLDALMAALKARIQC